MERTRKEQRRQLRAKISQRLRVRVPDSDQMSTEEMANIVRVDSLGGDRKGVAIQAARRRNEETRSRLSSTRRSGVSFDRTPRISLPRGAIAEQQDIAATSSLLAVSLPASPTSMPWPPSLESIPPFHLCRRGNHPDRDHAPSVFRFRKPSSLPDASASNL